MLSTLITVAITYIAGTAGNKFAASRLRKMPPGTLRDIGLHLLDGGPGHLPK